MKRIIAALIAVLCLFGSIAPSVAAASDVSSSKMICTGSGYKNYNNTKMLNQTMVEKYVTVSKNKVLQIKPYTITNNKSSLKPYVRFTIWIYDINTGNRIVNKVCTNGSSITWKNNTGKKVHLSVQVRPYIAQSAWNNHSYNSINSYIKATQYQFYWNNNYKK